MKYMLLLVVHLFVMMRFQYLAELVQLQLTMSSMEKDQSSGAPSYSLGSFKVFLQSLWLLYCSWGSMTVKIENTIFYSLIKSVETITCHF